MKARRSPISEGREERNELHAGDDWLCPATELGLARPGEPDVLLNLVSCDGMLGRIPGLCGPATDVIGVASIEEPEVVADSVAVQQLGVNGGHDDPPFK